ncbi:MAG: patatin-like phospholipase family protein [Nocardioidaceae bacterium]
MLTPESSVLVLGSGGVTGIAWELGVLAGLSDRGVSLLDADVILGTSAGAVAGAQLCGGEPLEDLYRRWSADDPGDLDAVLSLRVGLQIVAYSVLPGSLRRRRSRLGRAALRATITSQPDTVEAVVGQLPIASWPQRRLLLTAVDAESGAFTVFDRTSEVDLAVAVAASCAVPMVWPPVAIDGHYYMDGGMRSPANADLAAGAGSAVVLAPITQAFSRATRVTSQVERIGGDVRSCLVSPDAAAKAAIGKNMLAPAGCAGSARAGRAQGRRMAETVAQAWAGDSGRQVG